MQEQKPIVNNRNSPAHAYSETQAIISDQTVQPSVRRNSIWEQLQRMQEELDTLIDQAAARQSREPVVPKQPLSIFDTDTEFIVTLELPDARREDISVELLGNQLLISVINTDAAGQGKKHKELTKHIALPARVDTARIEASYKEGMLEIRAPKVLRSARNIPVR